MWSEDNLYLCMLGKWFRAVNNHNDGVMTIYLSDGMTM